MRAQGVGIIEPEKAISYGVTGPSLRGSGVDWDLRRNQPYARYDQVDFRGARF